MGARQVLIAFQVCVLESSTAHGGDADIALHFQVRKPLVQGEMPRVTLLMRVGTGMGSLNPEE